MIVLNANVSIEREQAIAAYGAQIVRICGNYDESVEEAAALAGHAAKTQGSVDSVMAGLACGATSPLAWKFLQQSIDHFMTIEDEDAINAMRVLALGSERDVPLIAGESAVAGLAGLIHLLKSPHLATEMGIDENSRILLISTEGATAPTLTFKGLISAT